MLQNSVPKVISRSPAVRKISRNLKFHNNPVVVAALQLRYLCVQEVHERVYGLALVYLLRHQYSHFVLDVSHNSWTNNRYGI
jgi:hypothetical protein